MGQPKLTLPWRVGDRVATIVERVVAMLRAGGVTRVLVVARRDDIALAETVARSSARLVTPEVDPPDMRASIAAGLSAARDDVASPGPWLVVPGDHPLFSPETVRRLLSAWEQFVATEAEAERTQSSVFVPTHDGRRGHPVLFAPELAGAVDAIPADAGLDWFVKSGMAMRREVPVDDPGILADLDTPADYEFWRDR
jgi:molybdenum cofactor cytidylyltransferase